MHSIFELSDLHLTVLIHWWQQKIWKNGEKKVFFNKIVLYHLTLFFEPTWVGLVVKDWGRIYEVLNNFLCERKKKNMVRTNHFAGLLALISLNGISKLFSSLESNPRSLEASLKFLLVAASAFIVSKRVKDKHKIPMFLRRGK